MFALSARVLICCEALLLSNFSAECMYSVMSHPLAQPACEHQCHFSKSTSFAGSSVNTAVLV